MNPTERSPKVEDFLDATGSSSAIGFSSVRSEDGLRSQQLDGSRLQVNSK